MGEELIVIGAIDHAPNSKALARMQVDKTLTLTSKKPTKPQSEWFAPGFLDKPAKQAAEPQPNSQPITPKINWCKISIFAASAVTVVTAIANQIIESSAETYTA